MDTGIADEGSGIAFWPLRPWGAEQIANATGAELTGTGRPDSGPERVVIHTEAVRHGALFVGLRGANVDGGRFAARALDGGAWGVLVSREHAREIIAAGPKDGVILAVDDPLVSLHSLATAWRRHIGAQVIGVTGSTGKTSTKDLLTAVIGPHRRARASRANFNTEIGLPLEILDAPERTEVLILEMGMRGSGQIAELAAIAEPDVGVIVSIGPVHLELLGSMEGIAAAKSELTDALKPGDTAVIPVDEPLLVPHRRSDLQTVTFGDGGDVRLVGETAASVEIEQDGRRINLRVPFMQAHMRRNLLAAVAAARSIGVEPEGDIKLVLSAGRGQKRVLSHGLTVIDDCYNANPVSMRASLDDLSRAERPPGGRHIAVLGDMLELGPDERRYHRELGEQATTAGVDVLVAVGPRAAEAAQSFAGESHLAQTAAQAAEVVREIARPGDTVLVKASRGIGLEAVVAALDTDSAGRPHPEAPAWSP